MNIDLIKNKTNKIMNEVHSRGEVNTHLDHKLERTLTSDQIKQRDALLQDKRVRLNYPLTANTYMNKSMKHLLIQMKKLSLRVNYKLDKNFDRWNSNDISLGGLNRVSFHCYFQKCLGNNHCHYYLVIPPKHKIEDVIKVIREEWVKLDPRVQKMLDMNQTVIGKNAILKEWFIKEYQLTNKTYSTWCKHLVDGDIKRYLGYSVREYIVNKDDMKVPKNDQYETYEPI
jgi:hypothetical protein